MKTSRMSNLPWKTPTPDKRHRESCCFFTAHYGQGAFFDFFALYARIDCAVFLLKCDYYLKLAATCGETIPSMR